MASRLRRDCSRRRKSALRRSASACSSSRWPTPDAQLFNDGQTAESFAARKARIAAKGYNGNGVGGSLAVIAGNWPAPAARDSRSPNLLPFSERGGGSKGEQLPNFVAHHWRAPTTCDAERGVSTTWNIAPKAGEHSLRQQATLWSSPSVADVEGGRTSRSGDRKDELLLNSQAKALAGPSSLRALVIERLGPPSWRDRLTVLRLYRTLMAPRTPTWRRLRAWARRATRPKLNAAFVEQLMGWPCGWTGFACSAEGLSLFKARMRSALSALPWPEGQPAQLSFFA